MKSCSGGLTFVLVTSDISSVFHVFSYTYFKTTNSLSTLTSKTVGCVTLSYEEIPNIWNIEHIVTIHYRFLKSANNLNVGMLIHQLLEVFYWNCISSSEPEFLVFLLIHTVHLTFNKYLMHKLNVFL